ncbi:MAG TPA: VCBS repeat-containing protein, partial [Planctomycetaceae bacterium]|nr:VCBS repeat-containing protein [Planctomycetaceae bacterium]
IDYDGDKHPDLLLANGFYGLRLYRNRGATNNQPVDATPKLGKWFFIGPFDNEGGRGFDAVYPPERNLDHAQQYVGRKDEKCTWRDGGGFADKQVNNLRHFQNNEQAVVYLHREIECPAAIELPISLGSDDGLVVWLNGEKLHSENVTRGCTPDQVKLVLPLKAGKNDLLLKISQGDGEWAFYFAPGQHQRAVPPLFEDVSDKAGLGAKGIGSDVKGDCLAVADIDGNSRSDFVYCAGTGVVVLNTPQGFVQSKDSGIQITPSRLQPMFGDVNGDGKPDLLVPHANGLRLFQNQGAGKFADATARAGALGQVTGKPGCAVFVETAPAGKWDIVVGGLGSPNRYLRNTGTGVFADATVEMGLQQRVFNTRGVSVVDLNKDGAPDMVFNNEGQESAVLLGKPLENVAAAR